ncbi:MAG: dihydrolipoamide acetyltransferase family protein [Ardenticatenia bacterium]|nr:dihydrolipoamide acetyltransferase family protein [Ardenticatenia bacterium]
MRLVDIHVPEGIQGAEDYVVVTWLKRVGDPVRPGEVVVVIQVEKVAYDVPSPVSGTLAEILVPQGEVAQRDHPLARVAVDEAEPVDTPQEAPMASPLAKKLAREHNVDLHEVQGTGRGGRITEKDVRRYLEQRAPHQERPPAARREVRASPAARRLAREHNVDLREVQGTGRGGRITEKDVLAFLQAQQAKVDRPEQRIPLAGMRGTIARRMQQSAHSAAQVTLHTEADVTDLVALRRQRADKGITYTDFIVRACALALREHPRLNAIVDDDHIRLVSGVHVGLAVALDEGLVVPVIRDADRHSVAQLAQERRRLVERARAGQLTADEMTGSTFTVTNLGPYEIDGFTPIINPPEVAILGVGRIVEKLVIHQGKVAQRSMMVLSLTFDHRAVDGAPAAAFLQAVKGRLESPNTLV